MVVESTDSVVGQVNSGRISVLELVVSGNHRQSVEVLTQPWKGVQAHTRLLPDADTTNMTLTHFSTHFWGSGEGMYGAKRGRYIIVIRAAM